MKRPNILIFMTDQQRGDSVPPYSRAITPNLDKFCQEGLTFSQAYCPAPHCCPSRATFFSGLYPAQHGVWNNVNVGNALSKGLYEGVRLWSEDLKDTGYDLYFSGKWHVSAVETPLDRGWDMKDQKAKVGENKQEIVYQKPEETRWLKYQELASQPDKEDRGEGEILRPGYPLYTHYGVEENPKKDNEKITDAINKIKSRGQDSTDKPWCQFIGPVGPHDPYFVPQKYLDMYNINDINLPDNYQDDLADKPHLYQRTKEPFDQLTDAEHKEAIRHYLAYCTYEDALFASVLDVLEETGEADNTLVIYLSDHGDYMAEHGLWCKGLPCFKSAYHIPAAIRWPQGIENPGRDVDEFVSLADFTPTILELAGIEPEIDFIGESLVPFIKDEKVDSWRDAIYTQTNGNELYGIQRSIMTSEWKYVYNGFDYDELYDLKADPEELNNLIDDPKNKEVVHQLSRRIWKFANRTGDVCINPYIMVGLAPFGPAEAFRD